MNIINRTGIGLLLGICCIISSCNDDVEILAPSNIKSGYTVPQGTHDFDTAIVNFYLKNGTYLLYKFSDKDAYWTPTGWKNAKLGLSTDGAIPGFLATAADEQYVGKQLKLLDRLWFRFYNDKFIKKFLPVKVMLCSKVQSCTWSGLTVVGTNKPSYYSYDNICVSYGSSEVNNISPTDSFTIAQDLNRSFMESMIGRGLATPSIEFTQIVSYSNLSSLSGNTAYWARGLFPPSYYSTPGADLKRFLYMMVTYPESYLTRKPTKTSNPSDNTEAAWEGILNPAKDVNGLLRRRYDMVRNYFIINYNMDLQQVGNYNTNY